jgi:hypothetical protein
MGNSAKSADLHWQAMAPVQCAKPSLRRWETCLLHCARR